uniref:Uncharacterized protein n=1 Tax=Romanomermis culicivorax TaxID=13658 RepID=A0A915I982_ROMCU
MATCAKNCQNRVEIIELYFRDNISPACSSTSDHSFKYCTLDEATSCSYCNKLLRVTLSVLLLFAGIKCDAKVHKECIPNAPPCCSVKRQASSKQFTATKSFNGKALGSEYLTFRERDKIEVTTDRTGLSGWWQGKIITGDFKGQKGLFPRDYVTESLLVRRNSGAVVSKTNSRRLSSRRDSELMYKNLADLFQYPWYVGVMNREQAMDLLTGLSTGTYLVRFSSNTNTYAISISCHCEPDVKHIKIECSEQGKYYLDNGRYFDGVVLLINYFQENSLKESFESLDTNLKYPVRSLIVGFAIALHNFQATAPNMISLEVGQELVILSKKDSDRGWWKGKIGSRYFLKENLNLILEIGYFPLAYVHEKEDIFQRPSSASNHDDRFD